VSRARTWNRIVALIFLFVAVAPLSAQRRSGPEVTATLSSGVVKLGGEVVLTVRVVNPKEVPDVVSRPTVDGLAIGAWNGPSTESSFSSFNGRTTQSVTVIWRLVIRPERLGEFELPPVELDADGSRLRTRPLRLTVVEDLRGADLGFCDLSATKTRVYEGEPLVLDLRFGWDRTLEVDYANLSLPWWGQLSGFIELEEEPTAFARRKVPVSLNGSPREQVEAEVIGEVERDGRSFHDLSMHRTYLPTRPGTYELPRSFLEFRRVVERGVGFFGRDRTERYYVGSDPLSIEVLPLPDDDRPFGFTGAVGSFDAWADVDRRDVDVGDSIKLSVEWSGSGNFEFFEAPDLERDARFESFRVYGKTEHKAADRRTVVYDLAPLEATVTEIPPIVLPVFDTEREAYVDVETEPIPIRVRALESAEGLAPAAAEEGVARDVRDIATELDADGPVPRPGAKRVVLALLGLPLGWLALRTFVRHRGDPGAPAARRRRGAKRRLARALRGADSASAQVAALDAFLADRSGESPAAWSGRDVAAYFAPDSADSAGANGRAVDAGAVARLVEVRGRLEAEAYGGGDAPLPSSEVLAVADELIGGGL